MNRKWSPFLKGILAALTAVLLVPTVVEAQPKEAKVAVDSLSERNGIPSSSGYGCLGVVLLGITVIVGLLN